MKHQKLLMIIDDARNGNNQEFNRFFRELYASCKPQLMAYASSEEMVREAYTEVMGRFWQKIVVEKRTLAPDSNIKGYIFTMARNYLRDEQRRNSRYRTGGSDILDNKKADHIKTEEEFWKAQEEEDEYLEALKAAIAKLGPQCQRLFHLMVDKGLEKPKDLYKPLGYNNAHTCTVKKSDCLKKLKSAAHKELKRLINKRVMAYHARQSDDDLIQRFFDFELNKEELAAFEERLQTDEQFFELVSIYKYAEEKIEKGLTPAAFQANEAWKQAWEQSLVEAEEVKNTAKVRTIDGQRHWPMTAAVNSPSKVKTIGEQWSWLMIAASICILLISGLLLWNTTSKPNYKQLAEDYYLPIEKTTRSTTTNVPTVDKNMQLIVEGQNLFQEDKKDEAIATFQAVIDSTNSGHKDLAYWYQALVYLSMENVGAAKANLQHIIEYDYPMADDANDLLQTIN